MIPTRQIQIIAAILLLAFSAILGYLFFSKSEPEKTISLNLDQTEISQPTLEPTIIDTNLTVTPATEASSASTQQVQQEGTSLPRTGSDKILFSTFITCGLGAFALLLRKYARLK